MSFRTCCGCKYTKAPEALEEGSQDAGQIASSPCNRTIQSQTLAIAAYQRKVKRWNSHTMLSCNPPCRFLLQ
ncbi:MAG TPA: hypothetical protein VNJ07_03435 [Chitinophagales bacterium]|nr:hypothetical protein [Chitinophagales bacterium]